MVVTTESTYRAEREEAAKRRKHAEVMADAVPGSWSRRAAAARAHLAYAQLTGDYGAYEAADRTLEQAFRVARSSIDDDAVGPLLLQAQLGFELHRLQPALDSLRVPEKQAEFFHDDKLLSEVISLRGAITFELGRYDEGLVLLRRSIELDPTPNHKQRLAIALAKLGHDVEAAALLDESERAADSPHARAWLDLQRANLALGRGRQAEARRRLERARAVFPGFWLIEEHLAELDADEGHLERAAAAYRALVDETGDPEFMDALAELIAEQHPDEARKLLAKSDSIYEERLARLPEASYGHALAHYLQNAPNAERALELAEKNRALRPNGEARTRLAQAYVRSGRIAEACAEARDVIASGWVSAETYATAAAALRLAGDAEATSWQEKADALDPGAMADIAWLQPL
jgi:tetratricopeptide (TPR) repeat protein